MADDPKSRFVPPGPMWAVLFLLFAALLAIFLVKRSHSRAETTREEAVAATAPAPAEARAAPARASAEAETAAPEPAAPDADRTVKIDAARRVVLLAAIAKALESKSHAPAGAPAPRPQAVGHLDKDYLKARIHELVPLIHECYELALDANPSAEGTVKVRFTVIGDEALGGVIEDSQIVDGTAAADPTLSECVRETMYGLRLKAPEGGGRVTVTYPFRFSHADGGTDGGSE